MSDLPRIRWEDHCWPVHTLEVDYCIVGDVQRSDGKWIGQVTWRSIGEPVSLSADTEEGAKRALLESLLEHHEAMAKALRLAIGGPE